MKLASRNLVLSSQTLTLKASPSPKSAQTHMLGALQVDEDFRAIQRIVDAVLPGACDRLWSLGFVLSSLVIFKIYVLVWIRRLSNALVSIRLASGVS